MESDLTWKHLSTFTKPIAARLNRIREGKIFAGDAERPADEWGAATGTDTPAAAGERVNLGEEEGTAARQCGFQIAGSLEARTAETATGRPTPLSAVSAGPLGW